MFSLLDYLRFYFYTVPFLAKDNSWQIPKKKSALFMRIMISYRCLLPCQRSQGFVCCVSDTTQLDLMTVVTSARHNHHAHGDGPRESDKK